MINRSNADKNIDLKLIDTVSNKKQYIDKSNHDIETLKKFSSNSYKQIIIINLILLSLII